MRGATKWLCDLLTSTVFISRRALFFQVETNIFVYRILTELREIYLKQLE